jgi:predicted membrane chloride channel (bestrophin family)
MTFRTNNSYDRWWEGRKLWDAIFHKCLDMGRVAEAWVAHKDADKASELVRLTIAFSLVSKKYMRQNWKVSRGLEHLQHACAAHYSTLLGNVHGAFHILGMSPRLICIVGIVDNPCPLPI